MAELLTDTDVFIDHLRGHRPLSAGRDAVHYSVVTRAELFAGRQTEEGIVATMLAPFTEIPVDRAIAERAGQLRRTHQLPMPDALIAATALERRLVLMTRNAGDFAGVDGLTIRQPNDG